MSEYTSQLWYCKKCGGEYEDLYLDENWVGQTNCKCESKKEKNIDEALKKIGEMINEKRISIS